MSVVRARLSVGSSLSAQRSEFVALVHPHWASMARLALRLAGPAQWEDVLQEALGLAWRKRATFDPDRGPVRGWLLALVVDQAGKQRRRPRNLVADVEEVSAFEGAAPRRDVDGRMDLDRALARLTRRQRVAVELYYFVGLSVTEAAEVMGCSAGTVKSTLSDARNRLRTELEVRTDV